MFAGFRSRWTMPGLARRRQPGSGCGADGGDLRGERTSLITLRAAGPTPAP
jgi:hypothetical protein